LSKKGVPTSALYLSTIGIALAAVLNAVAPDQAFMLMMGISIFGALFTWFMIFVTHLFFRKKWVASGGRSLPVKMIGYPYLPLLGAVLMLSIVITTGFTNEFKMTLLVGIPWLVLISAAYFIWKKASSQKTDVVNKNLH
jgi:AAT family amino acid transporter